MERSREEICKNKAYQRNFGFWSEEEQKHISNARIAVAGAGGDIAPADVFAVAEDVGLLLAEINGDADGARLAAAMPDKERAAGGIGRLNIDSAADHFLTGKGGGHLAGTENAAGNGSQSESCSLHSGIIFSPG